jgi:hypothetical protein
MKKIRNSSFGRKKEEKMRHRRTAAWTPHLWGGSSATCPPLVISMLTKKQNVMLNNNITLLVHWILTERSNPSLVGWLDRKDRLSFFVTDDSPWRLSFLGFLRPDL